MPDEESANHRLDPALRALEARLARASEAAERMIAEATAAAARTAASAPEASGAAAAEGSPDPPPAGWSAPGEQAAGGAELEPLVELLRSLRELVPAELQRRLGEALRELLLAVRALIDWYLERLEHRRAQPTEVEDIPID
jgi:hypothetical protein